MQTTSVEENDELTSQNTNALPIDEFVFDYIGERTVPSMSVAFIVDTEYDNQHQRENRNNPIEQDDFILRNIIQSNQAVASQSFDQHILSNDTNVDILAIEYSELRQGAVSDQSVIPFVDAQVVEDDLNSSYNRVEELHVVQIDTQDTFVHLLPRNNVSHAQDELDQTTNTIRLSQRSGNVTSGSDDNDATSRIFDKFKNDTDKGVRAERRFWIRFIILVILLNLLLVAGICAAVLCGINSCSISRQDFVDKETKMNQTGTPTLAPSYSNTAQDSQTKSPSPQISVAPSGSLTITSNGVGNQSKTKLSTGTVVGIAIVGELAIVTFLVVHYRCWRRSHTTQDSR
jgi:hypothetical protein